MDDTLAKLGAAVGARLRERRETIAVSESSTGGLISAALLSVPFSVDSENLRASPQRT